MPNCKRGHPMTAENVAFWRSGNGYEHACCRECNRQRARARRATHPYQKTGRRRGVRVPDGAETQP